MKLKWNEAVAGIFALFVVVVYYGGAIFPASIGIYTPNFAAIYALFLICAVVVCVLRVRSAK